MHRCRRLRKDEVSVQDRLDLGMDENVDLWKLREKRETSEETMSVFVFIFVFIGRFNLFNLIDLSIISS